MQVYARDKSKLDLAINAVGSWATAAQSAGVKLMQVNFQFPDAQPVSLVWDEEQQDWLVDS
jgi:hypothetical protein